MKFLRFLIKKLGQMQQELKEYGILLQSQEPLLRMQGKLLKPHGKLLRFLKKDLDIIPRVHDRKQMNQ
jgi:hypothetical protein